MRRFRVGAVVALLAASSLCGCGGGPKLVSLSGTVLLNGKPLKDAEIIFLPDNSNQAGLPAGDKTGPEGNYTAMSSGRLGIVPGKYKVLISKPLVDVSRVPKHHQDDPYMARIVINGPEAASETAPLSKKAAEIKGEFDREVPAAGGTLDFDVKAEVTKG